MRHGKGLIFPLLLALVACGHSPKTLILTLDAVPPKAEGLRADYRGPPIMVPAVHVPAALDRIEYVSEPGAASLRVDDFAHWGAPLGLLVRDALTRDLSARLPAGKVVPMGLAVDRKTDRVIDVSIIALQITPGGAVLQAAYRPLTSASTQQVTVSAAGAATPAESARTLGALIGLLADRMAADLR